MPYDVIQEVNRYSQNIKHFTVVGCECVFGEVKDVHEYQTELCHKRRSWRYSWASTVSATFTGVFTAVLVGTFPDFGTFRMDLMLVNTGQDITASSATVSAIPIPAAIWLFSSGLLGLIGIGIRKKVA